MTKEREYDTYCAYKGTMVVKSGYNQGGAFTYVGQDWIGVVISSLAACKCIDCANTDNTKCQECDWPKQLEQEFAKHLTNRCTGCMAQYKRNGYLRQK
jgi:hypothetical protein